MTSGYTQQERTLSGYHGILAVGVLAAEQDLFRGFALRGVGFAYRNKVRLKSVGRDYIRLFVKQLLALACSQVAHRSEAVGIVCGLLLGGVLADHVQLVSHLIAVIVIELIVQRLMVAGYRTAYTCGVRREQRADLGTMILDVE